MVYDFLTRAYNFVHETQLYAAILLGMVIQYMFSTSKTAKGVFVIVTITIFSAWFIVPMMIDIINILLTFTPTKFQIGHDSRIAIGLYASSSLVSVELVAIFVRFLPRVAQDRVNSYLGVKK